MIKQLIFLMSLVSSLHSKHGDTCTYDSDCAGNGWEICHEDICQHKDIWPLKEAEFWGMLLVAFSLFYTSLAGMSGGGLVVPVCIGCMRFDARNAIALSNVSIFAGSAIRFLTFSGEAHPKKDGKGLLVDHNLAVLTLPLIIMGVSVGVLANITVPAVIILGFFVLGCILLSVSIAKKANRICAAEIETMTQKEV